MADARIGNLVAAACVAAGLLLAGDRPAAAQAAGGMVTIGAILPLSGLFSTLGPPERDAMQLGIEAINSGGGFDVAGVHHTLGIASLGGATLDNEENYLIKKLLGGGLGVVNIENQARI